MQLVETVAEDLHLFLRGAGGERRVDTFGQALDASFQSAHPFRAHAFGDDRANIGNDARDIVRRDAGAAGALELRGEVVEFALRALAAVRGDCGARQEIAHFARLVEYGADRLRIGAAAHLEVFDLGGDGAHVLLEAADRFARIHVAQSRAQFARQLLDRRGDGVAHAFDARHMQAVRDIAHRGFERRHRGARGEFAEAARDGGDFAPQMIDRLVGAARAPGCEFLAHLLDALGHAVDVALKTDEGLRLRRAFGGNGAFEPLHDGSEPGLEFTRRAALVEGRTRLGAARGEGQRRLAIEFALAAHDLGDGVGGLRSRGRCLGGDGADGLARGALRHLGRELAQLRLDAREPIGVGASTLAAFEIGRDLGQFGIDFAQAVVATARVLVLREIVDAAFQPRQRAANWFGAGFVAVARHLLLDLGEPARDRLQRAAFAAAVDLRGFDHVDHFGKRARRLVLAARGATLVGFERALDQVLGFLGIAPRNFARAGVARQVAACAATTMGREILDAVVVMAAAVFLATPPRPPVVAHPRKTRGYRAHLVVVAIILFGFVVAGAFGDDLIQPFADAHAFALRRLASGLPRVEANSLDAPGGRLVHHLIRMTR
ncbi:MAG: hypothetical protein V9G24_00395 [Rhodoblastus sp.]